MPGILLLMLWISSLHNDFQNYLNSSMAQYLEQFNYQDLKFKEYSTGIRFYIGIKKANRYCI